MEAASLRQDSTLEVDGLTVQVLTQPAVNLALVHNSVPIISELRITYTSDSLSIDTTITVRLFGNEAQLASTWTKTSGGELPHGKHVHFTRPVADSQAITDPISWHHGYLRSTQQIKPDDLNLKIERYRMTDSCTAETPKPRRKYWSSMGFRYVAASGTTDGRVLQCVELRR